MNSMLKSCAICTVFAFLTLFFSGCTHLHSVSTTSVPVQRDSKVSVERSRMIVLALNFNNDYVNEMAEDLARQCSQGRVQGILTKHEKVTYFPLLLHQVRVSAQGYCVRPRG